MDTLKDVDNKVEKACQKNGLCTITRLEKSLVVNMQLNERDLGE